MQKKSIEGLLKSADPTQRMRGLKYLADNPTPKTAHLLATFASQDKDERVRAYASKREKHFLSKNPRTLAERMQEAHIFLDEAVGAMINQNARDARIYARRAFKLAPELQHDDLARDVAVDVMKMPADDAIELLLSERNLFEVDISFRKKMGYYSDETLMSRFFKYFDKYNVTLQDVLIDVGLYVVVITLPVLLLLVLATGVFTSGIAMMAAAGDLDAPFTLIFSNVEVTDDNLAGTGYFLVASLIAVLRFGFILFFTFAFQMVLTHFSANWFLGGNGSFYRLIHAAFIPVTGYSLFLWSMVLLIPLFYWLGLEETIDAGIIGVITMIGTGTFFFNLSGTIGRVYDFEIGKGCLALMFPYVVSFCLNTIVLTLFFGRVLRAIFFGG